MSLGIAVATLVLTLGGSSLPSRRDDRAHAARNKYGTRATRLMTAGSGYLLLTFVPMLVIGGVLYLYGGQGEPWPLGGCAVYFLSANYVVRWRHPDEIFLTKLAMAVAFTYSVLFTIAGAAFLFVDMASYHATDAELGRLTMQEATGLIVDAIFLVLSLCTWAGLVLISPLSPPPAAK